MIGGSGINRETLYNLVEERINDIFNIKLQMI